MNNTLSTQFEQYSAWRASVLQSVGEFQDWLQAQELYDAQADMRAQRIRGVLRSDKLKVAFIAEFSRGKSELINSIFFADFGRRILPSSAGRTTMCPTELMYDDSYPPSIRLLPIETRLHDASTADFRDAGSHWLSVPLDPSSPEGMLEAFRHVVETVRVPKEEAELLGLYNDADPDAAFSVDAAGTVEVSKWRHAIINFPHPMLKQGLVILDTPGLNAIGTEPELTLRLIPDAHVVVFVLAADAGVTKSDLEPLSIDRIGYLLADQLSTWWDPMQPGQGSMFESFVVLSEPFFNELVNRPVPVDMRALKALKQSPFALDVYSWLTYRFFTIQKRTEIPWEALQMQFGTETESERKFRALFRKALKDVLVVYPDAKVDADSSKALILQPSRTSVRKLA